MLHINCKEYGKHKPNSDVLKGKEGNTQEVYTYCQLSYQQTTQIQEESERVKERNNKPKHERLGSGHTSKEQTTCRRKFIYFKIIFYSKFLKKKKGA